MKILSCWQSSIAEYQGVKVHATIQELQACYSQIYHAALHYACRAFQGLTSTYIKCGNSGIAWQVGMTTLAHVYNSTLRVCIAWYLARCCSVLIVAYCHSSPACFGVCWLNLARWSAFRVKFGGLLGRWWRYRVWKVWGNAQHKEQVGNGTIRSGR